MRTRNAGRRNGVGARLCAEHQPQRVEQGEISPNDSRIEPLNRSRRREEAEAAAIEESPPRYLGGYAGEVHGEGSPFERAAADLRHSRAPSERGFSLIEFIGVLAVIAILAAAIAPVLIRRMDQAAWTREKAELSSLSAGLLAHVVRNKNVPSSATWATALSTELSLSISNIVTTPRGRSRAFLLDGSGWFGANPPPFTQTSNGISMPPISARLMIVSSIGPALPVSSGTPNASDFNDIWNTAERAIPSTWTGWEGNGDDVLIQRINVEPLFRRLLLVNADAGSVGQFSIDGSDSRAVPPAPNGWGAYYLDGTVVGLHETNGVLLTREILRRDTSFVFEYGIWRSQLQEGVHSGQSDFGQLVDQFLMADTRARAKADQTEVVVLMYEYMFNWVSWSADPDICFNAYGGKTKETAQYKMMEEASKQQKKVMERLTNAKKK